MISRSGSQIREDFLRFFESKHSAAGAAHRRVHSSSLVPANDPTLLFTNAGMNQFKDVFLGAEQRPYTRAVSSQKCVRAGGKHNDLENVGFTRRHHTFFEMLGNFSFGDYFKQDAIAYAWELLTSPDWFGIDPAKLYVTIFEGDAKVPRDDEASVYWQEVGVPKERIFGMSAKDNFWQMGDTGPCGPCSEIYYDLGLEAADTPGTDLPFPQDEQRYVEIWNLVFMQFDRSVDPKTGDATLTPLPKPSIDTGMGLERVAAVLQGVLSNFETDLFVPLIHRAAELTGLKPMSQSRDMGHPHLATELSGLTTQPTIAAPIECITSPNDPAAAILSATQPAMNLGPAATGLSVAPDNPITQMESATDERQRRDDISAWGEAPGTAPPTEKRAEGPTHPPATDLVGNASLRIIADPVAPLVNPNPPTTPTESITDERQRRDDIPAWGEAPGTGTPSEKRAEGPTHPPATDLVGNASLRIIADHARAATFLIADGVLPANEGRGYVLRKILRRGIRHGRLLGQEKPFMHEMVLSVRDEMAVAYPEIKETAERVSKVVLAEEEQFARVIASALSRLEEQLRLLGEKRKIFSEFLSADTAFQAAYGDTGNDLISRVNSIYYGTIERNFPEFNGLEYWGDRPKIISLLAKPVTYAGADAFNLYETYGLPLDFMVDAARDAGIAFDLEGFERAKEEEQARARASWKGGSQKSAAPVYRELPKTEFEGYTVLRIDGARVLALVKDGVGVPALQPGDTGEVVLDATSFYADSGGQVGDIGWLYSADHNSIVAQVTGATKPVQGVFAHRIIAKQTIAVGDTLDTVVDGENRRATERNHTGTHLLHAALREVLGKHVKQAGSLVDATRLRFDFSHFTGVAEEELREIESIVNAQVLGNATVETLVDVPIDTAIHEYGAMALFGEKYGDRVRVVQIGGRGGFSTELCGGTHTRATGEIGLLKLVGESSVSSGVRRVEALSGTGALTEFRRDFDVARVVGQLTGSAEPDALRQKLAAQEDEMKKLRRELDAVRMKAAASSVADSAASAVEVKGVKVLAQRVDGLDKGQMRELIDGLRQKLSSGVVVLGAAAEGKVALIVGVTKDLTGKLQAGKIVGLLAAKVGGKGGGRPDLAEAGGNDAGSLDSTLAAAPQIVASLLP